SHHRRKHRAAQNASCATSLPVRRSATAISADGCSCCAIWADVMASRISSKTPRRDPSIRTSKGRLIGFFPFPERVELSIEHLLATPKPRSFSTLRNCVRKGKPRVQRDAQVRNHSKSAQSLARI